MTTKPTTTTTTKTPYGGTYTKTTTTYETKEDDHSDHSDDDHHHHHDDHHDHSDDDHHDDHKDDQFAHPYSKAYHYQPKTTHAHHDHHDDDHSDHNDDDHHDHHHDDDVEVCPITGKPLVKTTTEKSYADPGHHYGYEKITTESTPTETTETKQEVKTTAHYTTPTATTTPYKPVVVKKEDPMNELNYKLHNLEHRIKDLESSEVFLDYFDVNSKSSLTIPANSVVDLTPEFCVEDGQTVEIDATISVVSTDSITLAVERDGINVALAVAADDAASTDANSMSVFYRATVKSDEVFQVFLENTTATPQEI